MKRGKCYMKEKINDKIKDAEKYIAELESILPLSLEIYIEDYQKRVACERYFEKIIEAVVDIARMTATEKEIYFDQDEELLFNKLAQNKVISQELSLKLKEAKGMRNIIAHKYAEIDDEMVFHAATEELINDVGEFIDSIKREI